VVIAGAGGAAHLPGVTAALTPLPVFGVPMRTKALKGIDSFLSILQMPAGIPVGTLAIGDAGAKNAALLAAAARARIAVSAAMMPSARYRLKAINYRRAKRVGSARGKLLSPRKITFSRARCRSVGASA
jgi:phosphoribosylaminoimidazole carboxylase PurE protein